MAATLHACSYVNNNFGDAKCRALFAQGYKVVFMPYLTSASAINGLDLSAAPALNAAYFSGKVTESQVTAWRPTPPILDFKTERADSITQDFNNGLTKIFVSDGLRTVGFVFGENAPITKKKIESMNKDNWGFMLIDKKGNLVGSRREGTPYKILDPIRIQLGSITDKFVFPGDNTIQANMVGFTVDPSFDDANIAMIAAESMTTDLRTLDGLIDADIIRNTAINVTSTGFAIVVDTLQGTVNNPILLEGLVKADFVDTNQTTGATITITTVTETAPGYYTFVVPSMTAGVDYKIEATSTGFHINPILITGV
jgi:hypothetical protein